MYIQRELMKTLRKRMFCGKILLIYGPRQAGKTTLLNSLSAENKEKGCIFLNGDASDDRLLLADAPVERIRSLLGRNKVLLIDEAQNIPEIGITLKRFADSLAETQVVVSGSSSFDLMNQTGEPLTGRKFEYILLPFSFQELATNANIVDERRWLESRLIYGGYPEIVTHPQDATERLRILAGSYLYKDILALHGIRNSAVLDKLLRALALQCGAEVSYREIGQLIGMDGKTVEQYIELLNKCFVVFTLPSFARNARNELKKSRKVFFYDCGIRNAVLGNFLSLPQRTDVGALWENYLMSERQKWRMLHAPDTRAYFWRTTTQSEVDLVEESASGLAAFEFKWNAKRGKAKISQAFTANYPQAQCQIVHPQNYDQFLG